MFNDYRATYRTDNVWDDMRNFFITNSDSHGWKPATTHTYAVTLAALLRSELPPPTPMWRDFLRDLKREEYAACRPQQLTCTIHDILHLHRRPCPPRRRPHLLLITLAWLTAHRPGDIQRLRRRDILKCTPTELVILVCRGKTVHTTGPYTVFTNPGPFAPFLIDALSRTPTGRLFPPSASVIATASRMLASVRPGLSARHIRRGALQAMAAAGAPDSTLLLFSRHTSAPMLHRYLDWGLHSTANREAMLAASSALHSPR